MRNAECGMRKGKTKGPRDQGTKRPRDQETKGPKTRDQSGANTKHQKNFKTQNSNFRRPKMFLRRRGMVLRVAGVSTPTGANVYRAIVRFFKGCHQGDPETLEVIQGDSR